MITNECAKEDFLLPVLERIEPEESMVDDSIRQTHTQVAQQQETADDGNDDNDEVFGDDGNEIVIDGGIDNDV